MSEDDQPIEPADAVPEPDVPEAAPVAASDAAAVPEPDVPEEASVAASDAAAVSEPDVREEASVAESDAAAVPEPDVPEPDVPEEAPVAESDAAPDDDVAAAAAADEPSVGDVGDDAIDASAGDAVDAPDDAPAVEPDAPSDEPAGGEPVAALADVSAEPSPGLEQALSGIRVRVSAELGRARLPLGQTLMLPRGTVIELDRDAEAAVDLYVNGMHFGRGHLEVTEDGEWALRLTSVQQGPARVMLARPRNAA